MKLLGEINESDVGLEGKERLGKPYVLRKAARAILINAANEISLQHVGKYKYHKLPGGGLDQGETIEEGLRREIREEVGCEIRDLKELGIIIEYRNVVEKIQISYCYIAYVEGPIGSPTYDTLEIEKEFSSTWATIEEAIMLLEKERDGELPGDIHGTIARFILRRDLMFLNEAKHLC